MEKRKTRRNVLWESADIDDLISKKGTAGLFIRWCLFDYKDRKENKVYGQYRIILSADTASEVR
uniref:hypothetical protein n=1 Tax=Gemmiger qucibialis TaxID=2997294 RepID=UPI004024C00C